MPRMSRFLPIVTLLLAGCAGTDAIHRQAEGALGPYSASVTTGELCFVSGQIAPDPDFAKEAEGALRKIEAQLERCGRELAHIVSATVYLTDMDLYGAFNEVYARVLPAPYPARACVAVRALPGGARVEVQVIAAR